MRSTLITALAACADTTLRTKARRFLSGLSSDELQFIADFVGACILENGELAESWSQVTVRLAQFQRARLSTCHRYPPDQDHKMILLLEFLCRAGMRPQPVAVRRHA